MWQNDQINENSSLKTYHTLGTYMKISSNTLWIIQWLEEEEELNPFHLIREFKK